MHRHFLVNTTRCLLAPPHYFLVWFNILIYMYSCASCLVQHPMGPSSIRNPLLRRLSKKSYSFAEYSVRNFLCWELLTLYCVLLLEFTRPQNLSLSKLSKSKRFNKFIKKIQYISNYEIETLVLQTYFNVCIRRENH